MRKGANAHPQDKSSAAAPTTLEYPRPSGQTLRYYASTLRTKKNRCRPTPEDNFWNSPKLNFGDDQKWSGFYDKLLQLILTWHIFSRTFRVASSMFCACRHFQ